MNYIGKDEAIGKMNLLGKEKQPFFFMISFDLKQQLILTEEELNNSKVYFQLPYVKRLPKNQLKLPPSILFNKTPIKKADFKNSFEIAKKHLDFGNTYLINLTKPTPIQTNLNFQQLFQNAQAPYKLLIEDELLVFSPEIFVKIKEGKISSYPMKGTINAAIPDAKKIILEDAKEIAEHNTIVDLIRNDLSMVSKKVRVERFRFIDEVKTRDKTLLQVSSEIVGEVSNTFFDQLGDHFYRLLPAGSISGAPKAKTLEVIQEAEQYKRGFYTGVFGYFDGESLDSAVMIRYIEKQGDQMVFKSGGGITTFSDCEKEYQELIDKVYLPIY